MENKNNLENKIDIFECDKEIVDRLYNKIQENSDYCAPISLEDCGPQYFFPLPDANCKRNNF